MVDGPSEVPGGSVLRAVPAGAVDVGGVRDGLLGGRGRPRSIRRGPPWPRPITRRDRVTAILLSEPRHDWHGHELAQTLQITTHNLLTQLAE